MMKRRKLITTAACCAGIALALSACSSSSGTASQSSGTGQAGAPASSAAAASAPYLVQPTTLPVTEKLSKRPPTGIKVAFLNHGNGYDQDYLAGMQAAGKLLGWNIQNFTVSPANPAATTSAVKSGIGAGDKYFVVFSTPAALYASLLPELKAKGDMILDVDSANPAVPGVVQTVQSASTISYTGELGGQALLADAAAQGKTAHIAEVTVPVYAAVLGPIHDGLAATVKSCSACSLSQIPIPAQNFLSQNVAPVIVSYLQAHPDINYLFFDAATLDTGVAAQIARAGLPARRMFGVGAFQPEFAAIKAGQQEGWVVAPSIVDGWIMTDTLARLSVGDDPNVWNKAKPLYYVLNRQNSQDLSAPPQFPASYQAMFQSMWGI